MVRTNISTLFMIFTRQAVIVGRLGTVVIILILPSTLTRSPVMLPTILTICSLPRPLVGINRSITSMIKENVGAVLLAVILIVVVHVIGSGVVILVVITLVVRVATADGIIIMELSFLLDAMMSLPTSPVITMLALIVLV